ncbi:MAG: DinB family protein [Calditrichia bacterium]
MQITYATDFLKYYGRIKDRTRMLFPSIPADKIEWTYQTGKFTIGDIIRHLALIERNMYAENAQFQPSRYKGCGSEYANGYDATIQFYNDMQEESFAIFAKLSEDDLQRKAMTPAGIEITLWKWLRAMVEHEVHHRGQLFLYLGLLGIDLPPLYGLTAEQVSDRSID